MRYPLIIAATIVLGAIHPASPHAQPTRLSERTGRTDSSFTLTPFKIRNGEIFKQKKRRRSDVVNSDGFIVVVVASWCPYSQKLLKEIADGTSEVKPALILFKENEIDDAVAIAIGHGQDKQKVMAWAKERREMNELFVDPDAVEYKLQYYFAPNTQLKHITAYPTVLACSDLTCAPMSVRDRLNLILLNAGMKPLGQ